MRTIWKFPLAIADVQAIEMPRGAHILSAQEQGPPPRLVLWAEVDPAAPPEPRRVWIVGTGHEAPPPQGRFVDTVQDWDGLVWHVYVDPGADANT